MIKISVNGGEYRERLSGEELGFFFPRAFVMMEGHISFYIPSAGTYHYVSEVSKGYRRHGLINIDSETAVFPYHVPKERPKL